MFLRVIAGMQVATLCVMAGISCRRTARDLASQEDPAGPHPSFDGSGLRDPDWDRAAQRDDFPW
jgi:hypothetical protein